MKPLSRQKTAQLRKILPALEQFVSSFENVKSEAELATMPVQLVLLGQQLKVILH